MFLENIKTEKLFKKKRFKMNFKEVNFKKLSKLQKFKVSNFSLTWSNEGKMTGTLPDMTYSKELQEKMKI